MLAHEQAVVTRRLDVEHLPAADAGRDAVGRGARLDRTVDDGAGGRHRRERGGIDLDESAAARDGKHLVECERGAGEDDRSHLADHPTRRAMALPTEQSAKVPAATRTMVPPGGVSA